MPMLIQHIDAIARQKQRGVLYLTFEKLETDKETGKQRLSEDFFDYEDSPSRRQIIEWLDAQHIAWEPCAHFANPNLMMPHRGQIYIDLPYDISLLAYQELEAFLENPDGSVRLPDTQFYFVPLEMAMKNAEHDEPGFWERWADNF